MSAILSEAADTAVVAAMEANVNEAFLHLFRQSPRAEIDDGSDLLRITTGIPHPIANNAMRSRLTPENADAKIAETLAFYQARSLPMSWWIEPSAQPADLRTRLEARGMRLIDDMPGMALNLSALADDLPSPPGLTIQEVTDSATLAQWTQALTSGYEIPAEVAGLFTVSETGASGEGRPLRSYAAYLEGEPVATSLLFLGHGVAGIYCVATIPAARSKGIGAAITAWPLRVARDLGYRVGTLQSSRMGRSVYSRLGFREVCKFGLYVAMGAGEAASSQEAG